MAQASAAIHPGLVLGGRYQLEVFLGKGAMGEVWRARHLSLGTSIALKVVGNLTDAETTSRLLMEARAAASIVSPHVVRIFDHGHDAGVAYIAMELLEGETLAERLRRVRKLSPHDVAVIVRGIGMGIAFAHREGIVHRDLKPENVFLARTGDGELPKVLDFGIAKSVAVPGMMTQEGIVVGTPAYLSREQVLGTHAIDARADLWALAILTYECLTGRLPYEAKTMAELFVQIVGNRLAVVAREADLPPGFGAWFERATHPDPEARHADVRELVEELTRILAPDLALVPWEMVSTIRSAPPAKRSRFTLAMLGALTGLAVTLTALVAYEALHRARNPAHGEPTAKPEVAAPSPVGSAPGSAASATATTAVSSAPSAVARVAEPTPSASASATPRASASVRAPVKRYDRWGL